MKLDAFDSHLKTLFKEEQHSLSEPKTGHQERFLKKLNAQKPPPFKRLFLWKPLAIAASFLLIIALGAPFLFPQSTTADLASVSPSFAQTQDFFITSINKELNTLKLEKSVTTQPLVEDALKQIKLLENDFETLKKDLTNSGNDQRVIYAMISNYQSRIAILQQVLQHIEEIKNLKQQPYETIL